MFYGLRALGGHLLQSLGNFFEFFVVKIIKHKELKECNLILSTPLLLLHILKYRCSAFCCIVRGYCKAQIKLFRQFEGVSGINLP